jgi:predicted Zn-dependent peptidase
MTGLSLRRLYTASVSLAPNQTRQELRGGAKLLTASLPDRPSASLVLMFAVGSRFEEDRIGGASHFVEHLLFKGTRRRPSAKDVAEAIDAVGGVMNASTGKEATEYYCRVPSGKLDLAVDVLCDIVCEPLLQPRDIELERSVILEELKMYLDQPQEHVYNLFEELMWPGHPLGRDIIGSVESVSGLTRDDLVAHTGSYYRRPHLAIGLAGAFDGTEAARLLEERLALPTSPNGRRLLAPPRPARPAALVHRKDTEQAHVVLGTAGLSYLDPDRYALELLDTLLGEGMSSRLFIEIREKRALAYDVHSFAREHCDVGYFAVYMGVDAKRAEEAVHTVQEELRRISEELVPHDELAKAKESKKGRLQLGLEGTTALATWLCQQELLTGEVKSVGEIAELIDAVTPEDLRRVAKRVLDQPLQLAAIGPFTSDAPFRALIGA